MAESRSKDKSPLAQNRQRRKKIIFFSILTLVAIICVYLLTSYLDKSSRGEKWRPFAFLFGQTEELTLPHSPTIPLDVLISIANSTTKAPTSPSVIQSTAESPADTKGEDPSAATREEPTATEEIITIPVTEAATTEEPTTEEPTTETPVTEEPTTPEPTTPEPVPETTEADTEPEETTEAAEPFDETDLSSHLKEAGLPEDQLEGTKLVVVRCLKDGHCTLYFFDKAADAWSLAAAVPASNGKYGAGGLSVDKLPGDKTTPAGYFELGPVYGMQPGDITKMPYHQFQSGDVWVTDPASKYYNSLQNDHDPAADWKQSISLLTQDETYKYAVLVAYNHPEADPARGTSVFLNVGTGNPTDGSIGLKEATLFTLLQWLSPDTDPHILIYQGQE